jgi:hypothetical protein
MKNLIALLGTCALLLTSACSSDDPGAGPDAFSSATGRYFPLAVGNQWTFEVTDLSSGQRGMKVQQVLGSEAMTGAKSGITAFRLRSDKASGAYTLSWQEQTADSIIRHAEQSFDSTGGGKTDELYMPGKLRVDESTGHVSDGATYTTDYSEQVTDLTTGGTTTINKTENWTVDSSTATVTVPAGTFESLKITRRVVQTGVVKTYWFVRGIGKVREEGASQLEELVSFSVAP